LHELSLVLLRVNSITTNVIVPVILCSLPSYQFQDCVYCR